MSFINFFGEFKRFILSNPKYERDLNDILSDTDLTEKNQIDEVVVLLEDLESHHGLQVPKADSDLKEFAIFIRNYYLTLL